MAKPVVPVVVLGIGAYLSWFAVHYFGSDTKWPTDPVKAVLQGKALPAPTGQTTAQTIQAEITGYQQAQAPGSSPSAPAAGATGVAGQTAAANQAIAKLLTAPFGWNTGAEWTDLVNLWNQESGWNNLALNPASGAFGIAQALGHGEQGTAGKYGNQYPSVAANDGDPTTQIQWGLEYIRGTYGDPVAAWAHEQSAGWY
jgi:resuscitation-promoting factor RpfB